MSHVAATTIEIIPIVVLESFKTILFLFYF